MKRALQLEGVEKVNMDFGKKLFTLTVDPETAISPGVLRKAVPERFKIPSIDYSGVEGTASKAGDTYTFTAASSSLSFELEKESAEAWKALMEAAGDDSKLKVSGRMREVERGEGERKTTVLVLTLQDVSKPD